MVFDLKKVKSVVHQWSDAHNTKDYAEFRELFSEEVLFYTQPLSKETCVSSKVKLLKGADYHQEITSDIQLAVYTGGTLLCSFEKTVTYKGETRSYPSYLLLDEINGMYLITGESDLVTDRNLHYRLDIGSPVGESHVPIAHLDKPLENGPERDGPATLTVIASIMAIILLVAVVYHIYSGRKSKKSSGLRTRSYFVSKRAINVRKGHAFENFVATKFAEQPEFGWIDWKGDRHVNGNYPMANRNPDLEYVFNSGSFRRSFAVECKFRSYLPSHGMPFIEERQLQNYRAFQTQRRIKVYIILGLGGRPEAPDHLYLFALDEIAQATANLNNYRKPVDAPFHYDITSERLT